VLFLPSGKGPFPGVIDMFGGVGGCVELRAALLAKNGYAVLALAYLNYSDLPFHSVMDFEMEYLERAASWLYNRPEVSHEPVDGIGVIGVCQGAQCSLLLLQKCPLIRVAVLINLPYVSLADPHASNPWLWYTQMVYNGNAKMDLMKVYRFEDGQTTYHRGALSIFDFPPVTYTHDVSILLLTSEEDRAVDGPVMSKLVKDHFTKYGKGDRVEICLIPGEGHLLEPPYAPLGRHTVPLHNAHLVPSGRYLGYMLNYNGVYEKHGPNQKLGWDKLLSFLNLHMHRQTPTINSRL